MAAYSWINGKLNYHQQLRLCLNHRSVLAREQKSKNHHNNYQTDMRHR